MARFVLYNSLAWLMWRGGYAQNRHQKVFNREFYVCAGGLQIIKFAKTLFISNLSPVNLVGLELHLGWDKSTKASRGDGTDYATDNVEVVTAIAVWTWSSWIPIAVMPRVVGSTLVSWVKHCDRNTTRSDEADVAVIPRNSRAAAFR